MKMEDLYPILTTILLIGITVLAAAVQILDIKILANVLFGLLWWRYIMGD